MLKYRAYGRKSGGGKFKHGFEAVGDAEARADLRKYCVERAGHVVTRFIRREPSGDKIEIAFG